MPPHAPLALDPNNHLVLRVGTGENNGQRSVGYGDGVYKSVDGGRSFEKVGLEESQHIGMRRVDPGDSDVVDVAAQGPLWNVGGADGRRARRPLRARLRPGRPDHLIAGNDGGVYEAFDFGEGWDYVENLPITQFYKVAVSTDEPFYYVYGGTQDDNTLGGPPRTTTGEGIRNGDRFVTMGREGFDPAVDSENPDFIYSQLQYRTLVRYDRASGERIELIERAVEATPAADPALRDEARALELRRLDLREARNGDSTRARRSEPSMPGIMRAIETLPALEARLEEAGAPWTPGRGVPDWDPPGSP